MSVELKIKSKHLALEPAIIKFEEEKLKRQIKWAREHDEDTNKLEEKLQSLINHRRYDIALEARATFIARAYIAGKSYRSCEPKSNINDFTLRSRVIPRVLAMVKKYHSWKITEPDLIEWLMRAA